MTEYNLIYPETRKVIPQMEYMGSVVSDSSVKLISNDGFVIKEIKAKNGDFVEEGEVIAIAEKPNKDDLFLRTMLDSQINADDIASLLPKDILTSDNQFTTQAIQAALQSYTSKVYTSETAVAVTERTMCAPTSGRIKWKYISQGNYVSAGKELCTIINNDLCIINVGIPVDKLDKVKLGAKVEVKISDNEYCYGVVQSIGETVNKGISESGISKTINVEVKIINGNEKLRHGADVSCGIDIGEPMDTVIVPYTCVQQDKDNNEYVLAMRDGSLKKIVVETGDDFGEFVGITSGLNSNDLIAEIAFPVDTPENYILNYAG